MSSNQIHETVIRDIVDLIVAVKDSDDVQALMNRKKNFRSIAAASSKLTLVFPVLVDKANSISSASMVTKTTETKAVSMLQMLFSAINISDSTDAMEYISQFHTNLNTSMNVDDFINAMDDLVNEGVIEVTDREIYDIIKEDLKNLNHYLPETISENSIDDFMILPNAYGNSRVVLKEAPGNTNVWDYRNKLADNIYRTRENEKDRETRSIENDKNRKRDIKLAKINANTTRTTISKKDPTMNAKDFSDYAKNQLLPSDVKKANELVPTSMVVSFTTIKDKVPVSVGNVIIGVKAKMYLIDSTDIANRLISKNTDTNWLNTFIRASTREISFLKDFVFAIDKAKIDALSTSRKGSSSKMWKVLERRAINSKIKRTLGQNNNASAITSLAISQDTVEFLKKTENMDIEDPRVIRPIMESLNLMCIYLIDETMETVKVLFDTGDDSYETLSFNSLERNNSDAGQKKMINLMTKIAK